MAQVFRRSLLSLSEDLKIYEGFNVHFQTGFGSLVMENRLLVLACGSSYIINNVYNKSAKDQLLILSQ